jgi:hypothetical protein
MFLVSFSILVFCRTLKENNGIFCGLTKEKNSIGKERKGIP